MIAQAVQANAGIGMGVFLGVLAILFVLRRAGRDVELLRDSVFFTAVAAGMGAWTLAAVMHVVLR